MEFGFYGEVTNREVSDKLATSTIKVNEEVNGPVAYNVGDVWAFYHNHDWHQRHLRSLGRC